MCMMFYGHVHMRSAMMGSEESCDVLKVHQRIRTAAYIAAAALYSINMGSNSIETAISWWFSQCQCLVSMPDCSENFPVNTNIHSVLSPRFRNWNGCVLDIEHP